MAKTLTTKQGTVAPDWQVYLDLEDAKKYLTDFNAVGADELYTCSSEYYGLTSFVKTPPVEDDSTLTDLPANGKTTPTEPPAEVGDTGNHEARPLTFSSKNNKKIFSLEDNSAVADEETGAIAMALEYTEGNISLLELMTAFGINTEHPLLKKLIIILSKFGVLEIKKDHPGDGYWISPNIKTDEETGAELSTALDISTRVTYHIAPKVELKESIQTILGLLRDQFGVKLPTTLQVDTTGLWIIFTNVISLNRKDPAKVITTIASTVTIRLFRIPQTEFVLYLSQTNVDTGKGELTVSLKQEAEEADGPPDDPEDDPETAVKQVNALGSVAPPPAPDDFTESEGDLAPEIPAPEDAAESEKDVVPPSSSEAVPRGKFEKIRLWYADINTKTKQWVVAVILELPISENEFGKVPIFLKYDKEAGEFSGGMMRGEMPEESNLMLPGYREFHSLPKDILDDNDEQDYIDLAKAFEFTPPKGLPTKLSKANITYKKGDQKADPKIDALLTLDVELGSGKPNEDDEGPLAPFSWESVGFSLTRKGKESPKFKFTSEFALRESEPTVLEDGGVLEDGIMSLTLEKAGPVLNLVGTAENINFGMLGKFFDSDVSDMVVDMLGKITIEELLVDYTYNKTGAATDFLFTGVLTVGKLKLDLFYQFASALPEATPAELEQSEKEREAKLKKRAVLEPVDSETPVPKYRPARVAQPGRPARPARPAAPPRAQRAGRPMNRIPSAVKVNPKKKVAWSFEAYLSAAGEEETLGSIIESITGNNPLPDFLGTIKVPTHGISDKSDGKPLISMKVATMDKPDATDEMVRKDPDYKKDKVVFIFNVALDIVEFSFVQVATKVGAGVQRIAPVRILRLSIGPLPFLKDIPIVSEFPQPYELLTYCYVSGPRPPTKNDLNIINTKYLPEAKIYYKAETRSQIIGLRLGHHFIIVNEGECVLDHVFGTGKAPVAAKRRQRQGDQPKLEAPPVPSGRPNRPLPSPPPATVQEVALPADKNDPASGVLEKKTKLLTISSISLQYKDQVLWLVVSATLNMGPVELSLIGFSVGFDLNGVRMNDFAGTFGLKNIKFQINGIAINFDRPPVLIAGVFIHEKTADLDSYRGGIAVGFKPYTFVAIGEYAEKTEKIKDVEIKYKTIFIYAKLDGPLVDLGIAQIKGARLGFGYNSFVRSPSVEELADFPFIGDKGIGGAGNNPMKILENMRGGSNPWVAPKLDSYWFAVGFSVAAFNLLTATAVALLGFTDEGVIVNIFADVICMMPPEAPDPEFCIVYVELLMNAELNFVKDCFTVQAALAPTSFLLVPQCHLYGGFAMRTWFGRSDYAGDWVFSIGGYHRSFQVPDHYPLPERLGISFNIGDNISMRGEGYFAITPKAVMGGALIYVQLSVGPVSAHLTYGFDAILQFNPLHYIVDAYVEVGVSCRIHLLFISFDISIEIGANLHIEGPEFGGVAHVNFWFFGFDIEFGARGELPPPLRLVEFYEAVAKSGPPEEVPASKTDKLEKDLRIQLKISLEEGAAPAPVRDADDGSPPPNAGALSKWRVKGGDFKFRVSSVFAITSATLETVKSIQQENTDLATWNAAKKLHESDGVAVQPIDPSVEKGKEFPVPAGQNVTKLSSIPMQVKAGKIESPLYIKIIREDASSTDLEDMYPGGWIPEFVVQPVPTALWGDPDHPPDALDNSKKGTVDLQMAVSISAPLPILSISKIKPVPATEIARQFVKDKALPQTQTQEGMTPAKLPAKPLDWSEMKTTWVSTVENQKVVAKSLVDGMIGTLGWDKPAPDVVAKSLNLKPKPWELKQKLPHRLVSGNVVKSEDVMDGLENFYLALPRVSVA